MSRVLCSLIALFVAGLCLPGPSPATVQNTPGTKTRSDTVDFNPNGTVEIDNRMGSITVSTWDRPQVGYEATLAPSEDGSIVTTDLDIDQSTDELSFDHDHSWSLQIPGLLTISPDGTSEPTGHFRIVMPTTASLQIDDYESKIEVSDVKGNVEIDTHQGSVTIQEVEGRLWLDTYAGTAEATGLRGAAHLETYEGRITATFEEFTASSSLDTYSGPLRVFLPSDAGFALETEGDSTLFAIDEAFGTPSTEDDRRIFNGGGPDLTVEAYSGMFELRPLDARASSSR